MRGSKGRKGKKAAKKLVEHLSPEKLDQRITELKWEMKIASKELRFEDAAKIRDEIKELNEVRIMF